MKTKKLVRANCLCVLLLLLFTIHSIAAFNRITHAEESSLVIINNHSATIENKTGFSIHIAESMHVEIASRITDIVKIEYFFDNDPGYGNGIPLAFTTGSEIIIEEAIPIHSLDEGIHIFYIRVCDDTGKWSQTFSRLFLKTKKPLDIPSNIARVEYFFDEDPGIGNGTAADFTLGNEITLNNNWNISSLNNGVHMLYVRVIDEFGQCSQVFHRLFLKTHMYTDIITIDKVEYFFDTDPGTGNGTELNITPGDHLTIEQMLPINHLSPGLHSLNIRCRYSNSQWGQLFYRVFIKYGAHEVVKVEYYFNDDPGLGNGTDIPITPSETIIIDETLPIDMLMPGNHTFFVRALSQNDKWSDVFSSTITVLEATGIDTKRSGRAYVNVYPNPTKGIVNLDLHNFNGTLKVQLTSMDGSVILKETILMDKNITIDLSPYSNGIYILRFLYGNKEQSQKIILNK